jgi:hypothetical protein
VTDHFPHLPDSLEVVCHPPPLCETRHFLTSHDHCHTLSDFVSALMVEQACMTRESTTAKKVKIGRIVPELLLCQFVHPSEPYSVNIVIISEPCSVLGTASAIASGDSVLASSSYSAYKSWGNQLKGLKPMEFTSY